MWYQVEREKVAEPIEDILVTTMCPRCQTKVRLSEDFPESNCNCDNHTRKWRLRFELVVEVDRKYDPMDPG